MVLKMSSEYNSAKQMVESIEANEQERLALMAERQRQMTAMQGKPTFQIPVDYHNFNKFIGMPIHPATNLPANRLRTQQYILNDLVEENKTAWIIVDKSKKIGITDGVLRVIAHKCFSKYMGPRSQPGEVMLVAGNRWEHVIGDATKVMPRFQKMLEPLEQYGFIADKSSKSITVEYGGQQCIINAYPSNPSALIGKPNVRAIFLDEAAFTGITHDSEVFSQLHDNLANTMGDFFMISTPRGRRGFFFNMWDKKPTGWIPKLWTFEVGLMWEAGNARTDGPGSATPMPSDPPLFDERFIDAQKDNPEVDFKQDFCGEFTSSNNGIFSEEELQDIFV